MRSHRRIVIATVAIAAVLLGLRALAPFALERYANARLAALPRYRGSIGDVDLAVWRGIGSAKNFVLVRRGARDPFISAERIELDLHWGALLAGRALADVRVSGVAVDLIRHPDAERRQLGQDLHWGRFLRRLPFAVDTFTATDVKVDVRNGAAPQDPPLRFDDVRLALTGLAGGTGTADAYCSKRAADVDSSAGCGGRLQLDATLLGEGKLSATGRFAPSVPELEFMAEAHLDALPLTALNPWLRRLAKIDADSGTAGFDATASVQDRVLDGGLTLRVRDADFASPGERERGALRRLEEIVVDLAIDIAEDDSGVWSKRVPLHGTLAVPPDPDLQSMFVALAKTFEGALRSALPGKARKARK